MDKVAAIARAIVEDGRMPLEQMHKDLQSFPPARHWHRDTCEYWAKLVQGQIEPIKVEGGLAYPVPKIVFAHIGVDMIAQLGYTPYVRLPGNQIGYNSGPRGETHMLLFAGKWVVPQLNVVCLEEDSNVRAIDHLQALPRPEACQSDGDDQGPGHADVPGLPQAGALARDAQ